MYWAGEFESEDEFEEALLDLKAYALLKEDESLHPLLAEFAHALGAGDEALLSTWAKAFAKQCYGMNGVRYIPRLYQHAQHALPDLLRAAELEQNGEEGEGLFYLRVAWLLTYFGAWGKGLRLYKTALATFEAIGDKAGEGTTLNNISLTYSAMASDFFR